MSEFPRVAVVEQSFIRPIVESIEANVYEEFHKENEMLQDMKGKRIALTVGSRGISNLAQIVRATVSVLKESGAEPFIVPAMGSHGGGTAQGQLEILADYGVTEQEVGAKVFSSMETVQLGETSEQIPVFVDKIAFQSDGIIIINRIKPHTDFHGVVESGLLKMIAIGLGKKDGAAACHSRTSLYSYDHIILTMSRMVINTGKIIGGVAILENAYHETAGIEVIPAYKIEDREKVLLPRAKELMPSLPIKQADILIIDQIGKNISGAGMDSNITGRGFGLTSRWQDSPNITRIIVLDITKETNGNAVGIGMADFCSRRVIDKMDREATWLNAITSRNVINAFTPLYYDSDREALNKAMISLGGLITPQNVRLLRIKDTLSLSRLIVSETLILEIKDHPNVVSVSNPVEMKFDKDGTLMNF